MFLALNFLYNLIQHTLDLIWLNNTFGNICSTLIFAVPENAVSRSKFYNLVIKNF